MNPDHEDALRKAEPMSNTVRTQHALFSEKGRGASRKDTSARRCASFKIPIEFFLSPRGLSPTHQKRSLYKHEAVVTANKQPIFKKIISLKESYLISTLAAFQSLLF